MVKKNKNKTKPQMFHMWQEGFNLLWLRDLFILYIKYKDSHLYTQIVVHTVKHLNMQTFEQVKQLPLQAIAR